MRVQGFQFEFEILDSGNTYRFISVDESEVCELYEMFEDEDIKMGVNSCFNLFSIEEVNLGKVFDYDSESSCLLTSSLSPKVLDKRECLECLEFIIKTNSEHKECI
jgi:hypothetical protein